MQETLVRAINVEFVIKESSFVVEASPVLKITVTQSEKKEEATKIVIFSVNNLYFCAPKS